MAAENESTPRDTAVSGRGGRGRGGRGGRGRGRGGGRGGATASAGVTKTTATRGGRGGTRRGRAKTFSDSRVQAAYERQRDLKAVYQAVAAALKPALQELADRSIEDLLQDPESYKRAAQYLPILNELQARLDTRNKFNDNRYELDLKAAESTFEAEQYMINDAYEVSCPTNLHILALSLLLLCRLANNSARSSCFIECRGRCHREIPRGPDQPSRRS
jgi:hypothetical protein